MLVGNSHLHLEMGEMQRLSSFFITIWCAQVWDSFSSVRILDLAREDFLNLPKDFGCSLLYRGQELQKEFLMRMIFPIHVRLILDDCCPLLMAVIILVFLPPFQDLCPLLSLSSPSFLKEWRMQCSITQSTSVADSKRLNLQRWNVCSLREEEI